MLSPSLTFPRPHLSTTANRWPTTQRTTPNVNPTSSATSSTFVGACHPAPAAASAPEGSAGGSDQAANFGGTDYCALAQQSIGMMPPNQRAAAGQMTCDAVGNAYPGTDCSWDGSACSRSRRRARQDGTIPSFCDNACANPTHCRHPPESNLGAANAPTHRAAAVRACLYSLGPSYC